jgi:hypothetical protein
MLFSFIMGQPGFAAVDVFIIITDKGAFGFAILQFAIIEQND